MLGAVIGDIIGSYYEWKPIKSKDFELFPRGAMYTDDTIMTIAVADAVLNDRSYVESLQDWGKRFPNAGYGRGFKKWLNQDNPRPYNSYGNGSAMRVSPIGYAFDTIEETLEQARLSSIVSHDHPEGVKGAQAVALAVYMARNGANKNEIRNEISARFNYDLNRTISEIRPTYRFEISCQKSVPESIIAFLESTSFEDAIRNAISLGGDSDTQACIAGAISYAFYKKIPQLILGKAVSLFDESLKEIVISYHDQLLGLD